MSPPRPFPSLERIPSPGKLVPNGKSAPLSPRFSGRWPPVLTCQPHVPPSWSSARNVGPSLCPSDCSQLPGEGRGRVEGSRRLFPTPRFSSSIISYPMWPTEVAERPGAGARLPAPHTMMRGANAQPTALVSGRGSNPSRVGHEGTPGPVVHSRRPVLPRGGGRMRNCFGGSNVFDIFSALRASGCNSSISNLSIHQ